MPLRYLFLDMNSFFASVEQQEHVDLRRKAVGVVPVVTDRTCCIAASYEAKACGVKTGTSVADAKVLCPHIRFALARPKLYVQYHHRIIEEVEKCLHVEDVCSIDEMYGRLYLNERDPKIAVAIAGRIKERIRRACGEYVRCSIGIAPNVWLAKVATDLQKPNGLTIVEEHNAEEKLAKLALGDLPGIGRGMLRRFHARGIRTVRELYTLNERELSLIWGSKFYGQQWWQKLRGVDLASRETHRRTVSHSHVLAPEFRNVQDGYGVAIRMLHKAAYRLRKIGYWAQRLSCYVRFVKSGSDRAGVDSDIPIRWSREITLGPTRDTITFIQALNLLWRDIPPYGRPLKVAVVLSDLLPDRAVSLHLFAKDERLAALADTMDTINNKYAANAIYSAAMHGYNRAAPERIAFTQIPALESFTNA